MRTFLLLFAGTLVLCGLAVGFIHPTFKKFQSFLFQLSEKQEESCLQIFKQMIHPRECCKYPMRAILDSHQKKCKKACAGDKTGGCCSLSCLYYETGILKHEKLNETAIFELYTNYFKSFGSETQDDWEPVILDSIKTCVEASKLNRASNFRTQIANEFISSRIR